MCGGGANNPTLMAKLREALEVTFGRPVSVVTNDEVLSSVVQGDLSAALQAERTLSDAKEVRVALCARIRSFSIRWPLTNSFACLKCVDSTKKRKEKKKQLPPRA